MSLFELDGKTAIARPALHAVAEGACSSLPAIPITARGR
jgi:hypothetical protein